MALSDLLTPEQAVEQLRKAENYFVPEDSDAYTREAVEGFVVRVKDILAHVSARPHVHGVGCYEALSGAVVCHLDEEGERG